MAQLRSRLHPDETRFLDCDYWDQVQLQLSLNPNCYPYISKLPYYIRIKNGFVNPNDLSSLQLDSPLPSALTPDELYSILIAENTNMDISELEHLIDFHNYNAILRKELIKLTALQILYSRSTLPSYGYQRAQKFIKEFNEEYQLRIGNRYLEEKMKRAAKRMTPKGSKRALRLIEMV